MTLAELLGFRIERVWVDGKYEQLPDAADNYGVMSKNHKQRTAYRAKPHPIGGCEVSTR